MMSRHDWAMLGLIGVSAFVSGGLTYTATQRIIDTGFHSVPAPGSVELSVDLGSEGVLFFSPFQPSVWERVRVEQGVAMSAPPLRLKRSESALGRWGKQRKGSLFRRPSELGRVRWRGNAVYMTIPAANLADRQRIHFRR